MNTDIAAGKWKQLEGAVKEQWGQLTDDELIRVAGKRERLHRLLRERYGYSEERAQAKIDHFYKGHVYDDRGQESELRRRSA